MLIRNDIRSYQPAFLGLKSLPNSNNVIKKYPNKFFTTVKAAIGIVLYRLFYN